MSCTNYLRIMLKWILNTDAKIHLNRIYSMPLFYILMTVLGFVVINKIKTLSLDFLLLYLVYLYP